MKKYKTLSSLSLGGDVYFFDKLLETVEYEKGIKKGKFKIIPLIETAAAVLNAQEICQASDRVIAIAYGCEDFISDLDVNEEGNLVEKVTVETIEDDIGLIVRVEVFLTADKTSDFKHSVEVVDDQILLNISPEAEE